MPDASSPADVTPQSAPETAAPPARDYVPIAPGDEGDGDHLIGPGYRVVPEMRGRAGVPVGVLIPFDMASTHSAIYPGVNGAYTRRISVYVPRQYVPGTVAPFMVVQDGDRYADRVPVALDNLIHEGRVPVMIAILISSGGGDGPGSQRGLEYDTLSDRYAAFIEGEVVPLVEQHTKVTLTRDPEGRATMGGSSGGAAAFTMAWYRPDLFRRVLSYSGSFVNLQSPPNPETPHGAWEYHERLIAAADRKPLRVYLEVGETDSGYSSSPASFRNWVAANQGMAAALKGRGYHYRFELALGQGHVSRNAMYHTLPSALEWLWRGFGL